MKNFSMLAGIFALGTTGVAMADPPIPPVPANAPVPVEDVAPGSLWSETESRTLVGMDSNSRQVAASCISIDEAIAQLSESSTEARNIFKIPETRNL